MKDLAMALRATLISPNVSDSNSEPANVVDVIDKLGYVLERGMYKLGHGDWPEGPGSIDKLADSIDGLANAIVIGLSDVAEAIGKLGGK